MGKMSSIFTDEEWRNLKTMFAGSYDDQWLAVGILRDRAITQEADLYKALFIIMESDIRHLSSSTRFGNGRGRNINYYWTLTNRLKESILKTKPWVDET